MKRLILTLLTIMTGLCAAWADTGFSGYFSLNGTMGESNIRFRIDLAYWGDSPCLVAGQTTYIAKNGKETHIKVYGTIDNEECTLFEFVKDRVCGVFTLNNLPNVDDLADFKIVAGTKIEGNWSYQEKSHTFNDVKLERYADVDYDFLKHPDWDWSQLSGEYAYVWETGEGKIDATLNWVVSPDSVTWQFSFNNEELGVGGDFTKTTPGYGHETSSHDDCFTIEVDDVIYRVEPMQDVLLIYLLNELPETDSFIDMRGVYPRVK